MKKCIITVLAIIMLISVTQISVFATGFETKNLTVSEEAKVGNRIAFSKYNSSKKSFSNFDVNEDGMMLFVSKSGTVNPTVYIYDSKGNFQYKYTVETDGVIYAEWQGNNIWIYIVRGDHAVLVDDSGTVLRVEGILDTKSNNSYWYEVWENNKTVGDKTYTAKTGLGVLGFFLNEYGQIVATDANNEEKILYNVSSSLWGKAILMMLFVSALVFVGISVVILALKRGVRYQNKQKYGTSCPTHYKRNFYDRILDVWDKPPVNKNGKDLD